MTLGLPVPRFAVFVTYRSIRGKGEVETGNERLVYFSSGGRIMSLPCSVGLSFSASIACLFFFPFRTQR